MFISDTGPVMVYHRAAKSPDIHFCYEKSEPISNLKIKLKSSSELSFGKPRFFKKLEAPNLEIN